MKDSVRQQKAFICWVIKKMGMKPHSDLVQCGFLGMMRARRNHDDTRGKFSTFAYLCVRQEVGEWVRQLKRSERIMARAMEFARSGSYEPEGREDAMDAEEFVKRGMQALTARERLVVTRRVAGDTLAEVGLVIARTKELVRHIERKAFEKMKQA